MADIIPFDDRDGSLWYDGKLVPWRDAKIHVLTHGLHYASCVFEGERIYSGRIYKLAEHTARLFESARILDMKIPYTEEEINAACYEVVRRAGHREWLYPSRRLPRQRDDGGRGARTRRSMSPSRCGNGRPISIRSEKLKGIRLDISQWRRPAPDTAPTQAKAAGLYMICTISKHAAEQKGYADAMMFDYRGYVAEATGREHVLRQGRRAAHADCRIVSSTASRANR